MNKLAETKPPTLAWLLVVLFGLPLAIMVAKWPGLPTSEFVNEHVSLATLSPELQAQFAHILFVPLGAMLVVLVRLTLGLRVLGPFRSILLAVAFQITGVVLGVLFLAVTIAVVVAIRPSMRSLKLPYFGRITVMLSTVAVLMMAGVMAGGWFDLGLLQTIVYFPIVVLCLVADAFARTVEREGFRSALWRGALTAMVAIVLTALAGIPWIVRLVIDYPELLIAQIGGIIVISRLMAWRLFAHLNPKFGEQPKDDLPKEDKGQPPTASSGAGADRPMVVT
jgi:hypothetical protein